jgi:hypothetical protein
VEEVEQVKDITAITGPPVSATEEVVPLATQFPPWLERMVATWPR